MMKVKRMEKGEAHFMEPYADGSGFHEVTVQKFRWKCPCGLVWTTRTNAQKCGDRGHKREFFTGYGGRIVNGKRVGATGYKICAVRKDPPMFSFLSDPDARICKNCNFFDCVDYCDKHNAHVKPHETCEEISFFRGASNE